MTYATKQDLVDRFGEKELRELTDRVNRPPSTIDDVVVGRALGDADDLIDGYLSKLYALPMATPPSVLTRTAADIARFYLHGRSDKDSAVARAHDQAIAWLKDVARGLVSIDADGVAPAQAGGGTVQANPSSRVFTRDTLRDA